MPFQASMPLFTLIALFQMPFTIPGNLFILSELVWVTFPSSNSLKCSWLLLFELPLYLVCLLLLLLLYHCFILHICLFLWVARRERFNLHLFEQYLIACIHLRSLSLNINNRYLNSYSKDFLKYCLKNHCSVINEEWFAVVHSLYWWCESLSHRQVNDIMEAVSNHMNLVLQTTTKVLPNYKELISNISVVPISCIYKFKQWHLRVGSQLCQKYYTFPPLIPYNTKKQNIHKMLKARLSLISVIVILGSSNI